jgi:GNAT superfamily N-acetyltransferase
MADNSLLLDALFPAVPERMSVEASAPQSFYDRQLMGYYNPEALQVIDEVGVPLAMMGVQAAVEPIDMAMSLADTWNSGKAALMDALAGEYKSAGANTGLAGMSALGLLPMIPAMHTVYHGGPGRWAAEEGFSAGRPRLDKMGTGEGGQAFRSGFYSAEAPDTALTYQPRDQDYEGEVMKLYKKAEARNDYDSLQVYEDALLHKMPSDLRQTYLGAESGYDPAFQNKAQKAIQQLEKIPQSTALYKLDMPDDALPKLLDWDKPLGQQSQVVQDILRPLLPADAKIVNGSVIYPNAITSDLHLTAQNDAKLARNPRILDLLDKYESNPEDVSVRRQLNSLFTQYPYDREAFKAPLDALENQWSASTGEVMSLADAQLGQEGQGALERLLAESGVPGLQYLDSVSRGAGDGTRNFVIWDQSVLDRTVPLEVNGVPTGLKPGDYPQLSQAVAEPSRITPDIWDDVYDHYAGESFGSVYATHPETKEVIGKLDYGHTKGEPLAVKWIEVAPEYRRQGIATKLVEKAKQEYGDNIDWGMSTDDGTSFIGSLLKLIPE